jgi:hypothetical protein
VPTNKQRREASRRHLERQLQRRQERDAARKRFTLIASIIGTIVLIGLVVGFIVIVGGEDKKKNAAASSSPASSSSSASPSASPTPSTSYPAAKGASVTFEGVTVAGAADLAGKPTVTSKGTKVPTKVEYKDLVVGRGAAAKASSTVTVQYVGVLYKDGKVFDSSWARGQAAQFSLAQVIQGFTQGIGGTTGVPAMKVGGRRIIILPASLGYGAQASGSIPANSTLVFVVDLKSIDS